MEFTYDNTLCIIISSSRRLLAKFKYDRTEATSNSSRRKKEKLEKLLLSNESSGAQQRLIQQVLVPEKIRKVKRVTVAEAT